MKRKQIIIVAAVIVLLCTGIVCSFVFGDSTSHTKNYSKNVTALSSVINKTLSQQIVTAMEKSCVMNDDIKITNDDIYKINDDVFEVYLPLMVRVHIQNEGFVLSTYETTYSNESAIILYDSTAPEETRVLTKEEINSLHFTQRRTIVHNTIRISPSEGEVLHNALGTSKIELSFTNCSDTDFSYVNAVITPYIGSNGYTYNNRQYSLADTLSIGSTASKSLTTSNWSNYSKYKISSVSIMFTDGTTIGLDNYDCQFLSGNGNDSIVLSDGTINYHLYEDVTELSNFYSGFGKQLYIPYRYHYTFQGWYNNVNLNGEVLTRIPIGNAQNYELYAKWIEDANVILNYNYDDKTEKVYLTNKDYTLQQPYRVGYTFGGWYENTTFSGDKIEYINNQTQAQRLYAKWTGNTVYLQFDGNGHTDGEMQYQKVSMGEVFKLNKNQYSRDGYEFVGWTTDPLSNDIVLDESDYAIQGTNKELITLYAKWSKTIYTAEDFNAINEYNSGFYSLANDIDFSQISAVTVEDFYGIFNGNGHTLENSNTAFFKTNSGTIKQTLISNCQYSNIDESFGGFAVTNAGYIANCSVVLTLSDWTIKYGDFGGFCAHNAGKIMNCSAKIDVKLNINRKCLLGGFVASHGNMSNCEIKNCYSDGNITIEKNGDSGTFIGGFVSQVSGSDISYCYSNVIITHKKMAPKDEIGGFLCYLNTSSTISNCFAVGKIMIEEYPKFSIGGFAADSYYSNLWTNIFRCDVNIFDNALQVGTLIEKEMFYDKNFYTTNNLLNLFTNTDNLTTDNDAVWIIVDGQLPKLYWQKI